MSVVPAVGPQSSRKRSTSRLSDHMSGSEPHSPRSPNRFQAGSPSKPTAMLDGLLRQLTAMDRPQVQSTPLNGWPEEQLSNLPHEPEPFSYAYAYAYAPPASAESVLTRSRSRSRSHQGGSFSSVSAGASTSSARSNRSHFHVPAAHSIPAASPSSVPSPVVSPTRSSFTLASTAGAFPMPPSGLQVPSNPSARARSLSHSNSTPSLARPRSGSHHSARAASSSIRERDTAPAGRMPVPMSMVLPAAVPRSPPSPPRMAATRSQPGPLYPTTPPQSLRSGSAPRVQTFDALPTEDLHWETCSSPPSASPPGRRLNDLSSSHLADSQQQQHRRMDRPALLISPGGSDLDSPSASVFEDEEGPKPKFAKLRGLSDKLRGRVANSNINMSALMFPFVPSDFAPPPKKDQGARTTTF